MCLQELVECLGRCPPTEGLAWPPVEREGDGCQIVDADGDFLQVAERTLGAVGPVGACVEAAQVVQKPGAAPRASRRWAITPRIESARGDPEGATHRRDRIGVLVLLHEWVDPLGSVPVSRANQAAALDR